MCHNPYFSRWFSAIALSGIFHLISVCHNPYFSRWFSAIKEIKSYDVLKTCHNPYFSRWFSAMRDERKHSPCVLHVTILILVDGFLQYEFGRV